MPIVRENEFKCPRCNTSCKAAVSGSINVQNNPADKKKILDGSFFQFACTECGYETRLIYNCLYLDPMMKQMFYLIEGNGGVEEDKKAEEDAIRAADDFPSWKEEDYILRVVHSANDLREKLLIFDNGFDDRIVEICKGVALSQVLMEDDAYITEIHFEVVGKMQVLVLFSNDGEEQYVTDFQTLYRKMEEHYKSFVPPLHEKIFQCVNVDYAAEFLQRVDGPPPGGEQ
jgi:hypothetical protein